MAEVAKVDDAGDGVGLVGDGGKRGDGGMESPLFREDAAVFMFYSKSQDVPPGKGASETPPTSTQTFSALQGMPQWRKKLSNFYVLEGPNKAQFVLDDRHWASVEHYFQASKFRHIDDSYYESFTIESGSSLGLGGGTRAVAIDSGSLARTAGRKLRLNQQQLDQWAKRKHAVMERALYAKFSQNPSLKALLLATGDAKLTHRPSRSKFVSVEYDLMRVRQRLKREVEGLDDANGGDGDNPQHIRELKKSKERRTELDVSSASTIAASPAKRPKHTD